MTGAILTGSLLGCRPTTAVPPEMHRPPLAAPPTVAESPGVHLPDDWQFPESVATTFDQKTTDQKSLVNRDEPAVARENSATQATNLPPQPTPDPSVTRLPGTDIDTDTKSTTAAEAVGRVAPQPREWTAIVIHHTATNQGSVESIHEAHLAKKWLGIGYHYVIGNGNGMPDGSVEPTFRWREQLHGAHAGKEEFNQHGVGIVLVGNFEDAPPTDAQMKSLQKLISELQRDHNIAADRVIGHSDVKATACPGKQFPWQQLKLARANSPPAARTSRLALTNLSPAMQAP